MCLITQLSYFKILRNSLEHTSRNISSNFNDLFALYLRWIHEANPTKLLEDCRLYQNKRFKTCIIYTVKVV